MSRKEAIELSGRNAAVSSSVREEEAKRLEGKKFQRVLVRTGEKQEPVDLNLIQEALRQRGVYVMVTPAPEGTEGVVLTPINPPETSIHTDFDGDYFFEGLFGRKPTPGS